MKYLLALALLSASPAAAEVVSADAHGFEVRYSVQVNAPGQMAWESFSQIGKWWSPDHSYSGDASNLSLKPVPGGCFCERIGNNGGVEHLRVAVALPPKRLVMTGSLGPLLYEAVAGVMDVKFEEANGRTTVSVNYRASGFVHGNAADISKSVDAVLSEQLARFVRYSEATAAR